MNDVVTRAVARLEIARQIIGELNLLTRWAAFGTPMIVGAVAYGLVVAPDIDLEIFCDDPRIADGFEVLKACAQHANVTAIRFANQLAGPDQGLYWRVGYQHAGELWKLDMWSMRRDHPGPRAADLVEPLRAALTAEFRTTILTLKEQLRAQTAIRCPSIAVYQAVIDHHVRTLPELATRLKSHDSRRLTAWRPQIHGQQPANDKQQDY